MQKISIKIRERIASADDGAQIICGNSDYAVEFDFDDEWLSYKFKTARFVTDSGGFTDVQFEGDTCAVPILSNTRVLLVGVFAGDVRTTTAAMIRAIPCITDPNGIPAAPAPDVYAQLMENFNRLASPSIGNNGNWFVGGIDTGHPSRGEKGDTGAAGADGKDGKDGKTPVAGADYFTEADKTAIVSAVLAAIPNGDEVAYG